MNTIQIANMEGLEYLKTIENNSIDLVLTDPPYITSRDTGMDKWVDHVDSRDGATSNFRSESSWRSLKTAAEWKIWCDQGKYAPGSERLAALKKAKKNYLKYGSIYGKMYAVKTDYGKWDSEFTMAQMQEFINEFYRVLRPGGTCIIFFDIWKITPLKAMLTGGTVESGATGPGRLVARPRSPHQKEGESNEDFAIRKHKLKNEFKPYYKGFQGIRFIEWIKTNPQPLNSSKNYLTNCREIALMGIKGGGGTFHSKYDNAIYSHPLQGGKFRIMPTQKSTRLCEDLIEKHSNPGDIVLDPFMGSGTTAVAAYNVGRNAVGCEMREDMYDQAIDRIKGELEC
jgi:site-specific DNA-methyltransferase (adenine-specific)